MVNAVIIMGEYHIHSSNEKTGIWVDYFDADIVKIRTKYFNFSWFQKAKEEHFRLLSNNMLTNVVPI